MIRLVITLALSGLLALGVTAGGALAHDGKHRDRMDRWEDGGEGWRGGGRMHRRWWKRKERRERRRFWKRLRRMQLYRADANKDGEVTWKEVETLRGKYFAKFDLNKDGVVSQEEIAERVRKRVNRRAKRITRWFDENGDGKISKSEFNAQVKDRFSWRDLNNDDKLSEDELPMGYYRMRYRMERLKGKIGNEK